MDALAQQMTDTHAAIDAELARLADVLARSAQFIANMKGEKHEQA